MYDFRELERGNFYMDGMRMMGEETDYFNSSEEGENFEGQELLNVIGVPASQKYAHEEQKFKDNFMDLLKTGNYAAAVNFYKSYGEKTVSKRKTRGAGSREYQRMIALLNWMKGKLTAYRANGGLAEDNSSSNSSANDKGNPNKGDSAKMYADSEGVEAAAKNGDEGMLKKAMNYIDRNKWALLIGTGIGVLGVFLWNRSKKQE